jgi:hypothetical protein
MVMTVGISVLIEIKASSSMYSCFFKKKLLAQHKLSCRSNGCDNSVGASRTDVSAPVVIARSSAIS